VDHISRSRSRHEAVGTKSARVVGIMEMLLLPLLLLVLVVLERRQVSPR
jgi:hypothetical protein